MRVGIKVLRNGQPAVGVALVPNLPLTTGFPLIPAFPRTDVNGEWFGVVPLAISPAVYLMDVVVDPEGSSIRINGSFDEIETQLFVDLSRPTGERQRLGARIPRAGYFEVDHRLLQSKEIVIQRCDLPIFRRPRDGYRVRCGKWLADACYPHA